MTWKINGSMQARGSTMPLQQEKPGHIRRAASLLALGIFLLGFIFIGPGWANPGEPHGEHGPILERVLERCAERLGLDDTTLTAIRTLAATSRQDEETLRAEIHQAHDTMRALLSQDKPEESAVMQQAERIGALELAQQKQR